MIEIKYFTDPGHGWAACKIETLHALGIAGQISFYSYMRGKTAYLEEDCDFALLLDALTRQKYLAALLSLLTVDEIKRSAAQPSAYMTQTHIKLHFVALRRLGAV
jgi:hypothetical protein